jgi:23S rRNA (guanosine2251-2'-O)-methyltransferase
VPGRPTYDRSRPAYDRPRPAPVPRLELDEGEEVVAGRRPVEEAFAARREAHRLLVVPDRRAALDQLVLHATTLRIPVVEVEGGSLTTLCGFDGHQGVALIVAPRRWSTIEEVLAAARAAGEAPFVLVLDHLEDPQNVGTLLRSAEAAGVHGVVFPTRRSAPISPAAVKASAGATEHLRLVPVEDLPGTLVDLHGQGLRIVGADEEAALTIREVDLRGPLALVVGSEGAGIGSRVRRRVDAVARIAMRGRVGSLNASVAGSILLFEAVAQRAPTDPATGMVAALPAEMADAGLEAAAPSSSGRPPTTSADPAEVVVAMDPAAPQPVADEALLPEPPPRPERTSRKRSTG